MKNGQRKSRQERSASAILKTTMPIRVSTSSNSELAEAPQLEEATGQSGQTFEACPLCGQTGAQEWLSAPDRLHGRQQNYSLARCSACSVVWLSHPPQAEEMHHHYTDAYHKLISAAGETSPWRWQSRKAELAEFKQSGALLDLGCSSGSFLESLPGDSWKLYGIEMSSDCAKRAEARSGAKVFVGDILEAPFPPESFDVITCFDVLEHLYEPRRVMAKITEWLKPGGIFYVFVPNIDSAEARVFRSHWCGLELPRHLFHYSPASLRYLAKSVGLEEVSLVTSRNPAVGNSLRYFFDDLFRAVGISRTPLAYLGAASLPWKVARRVVRMTVLRFLLALAPLAGGGEAIHGSFRKGSTS
jgi:2-polyprenyl-3-methyl-5-hydroxy-6-metoxy-1,4-benzoquinol methylase